jgi:hypothetical protein
MTEKKYRHLGGYLVISLYFGWFILAAWSDRPIEVLSRYVPGWVAMLIWASWLVLAPIGRGPLNVPESLRMFLAASFLLSCLLLPVAVRSHLVASALVGVLLVIEQLWLIPWWKAGFKRGQEPRQL